jgi:hypothetical protein
MRQMRNAYSILVRKLKRRDHLEDIGVDGRIILEWVLEKYGVKIVDWMHLAQDKDQWRALVNTVINFWFL